MLLTHKTTYNTHTQRYCLKWPHLEALLHPETPYICFYVIHVFFSHKISDGICEHVAVFGIQGENPVADEPWTHTLYTIKQPVCQRHHTELPVSPWIIIRRQIGSKPKQQKAKEHTCRHLCTSVLQCPCSVLGRAWPLQPAERPTLQPFPKEDEKMDGQRTWRGIRTMEKGRE